MTTPTTTVTPTSRTITLVSGQEISVAEYGQNSDGSAVLMLHGGAGPRSMAGFAAGMAEHAYVLVPTHPGFDGAPRAEGTTSIADLAEAYLDLIEALGLEHVFVVGSSLGGWIASEMGLRDNHGRVSALTLLGASGITPEPGTEIADPAQIGTVRTGELAFHNPKFRLDPAALTDAQRANMVANAAAQALYGGADKHYDPKLAARLHRVTIPVLVIAGEQDGIVPLAYQRNLAAAFPRSTFRSVPEAGHFPHMEQPGAVFGHIGEFVDTEVKPDGE
jgi:pimeloyl-ACP methyl ester carboxylesterase